MDNPPSATPGASQAAQEAKKNYFQVLSAVDVTPFLVKKGEFNYLPWPDAMRELLMRYEDSTIDVIHYNGLPYLPCPLGFMVEVAVTVCGITRKSLLPVMDDAHTPILQPNAFDINTSIQRCTVKAIALHGLGLSVYAGMPDISLNGAIRPVVAVGEQQATSATAQVPSQGPQAQSGAPAGSAEHALEAEDEANLQNAFSRLKVTDDPARLKNALVLIKFKSKSATSRFHTAVAERALSLGGVLADIFGDLPIPKVDLANVKVQQPKAVQPAQAAQAATTAPAPQAAPAAPVASVAAASAPAPAKPAPAASPASDSSSFF